MYTRVLFLPVSVVVPLGIVTDGGDQVSAKIETPFLYAYTLLLKVLSSSPQVL